MEKKKYLMKIQTQKLEPKHGKIILYQKKNSRKLPVDEITEGNFGIFI